MPDASPHPCENPLWPCAMTGAVACLCGFEDLGVLIHGSSGCYFYTASLLEPAVHGTCILESEIIFGSHSRLFEVVEDLASRYARVAVVNTCVPAVIGEDLKGILNRPDLLVIDSPGFCGDFESGYKRALEALSPIEEVTDTPAVNIDGLNPADPFYRGNSAEAKRLIDLAGLTVGTCFAKDSLVSLKKCAPATISANPDISSSVGQRCGSLLGLQNVRSSFERLSDRYGVADIDAIAHEVAEAEERIGYACDKYLRRFDPPVAGIFGNLSYALFAAGMLEKYLDADIAFIGARNDTGASPDRTEVVKDLGRVEDLLDEHTPDLILGSTYEHSLRPDVTFIGLIPPLRNRLLLHARPLVGVEGSLLFMEEVLNACRDRRRSGR